jgi:D-alanyl-lipoteichoic acid acyltransferase DltB (MBOAT superfamily)
VLFNSIEYLVFLAVVCGLCWFVVPTSGRRYLLLAASYFFYAWWSWQLVGLLVFVTAASWLGARVLHRMPDSSARRLVLAYTLALTIGVLVAFKVYGYFLTDLDGGVDPAGLLSPSVGIFVPLGLSYYTLQAASYVIDVARREQEPEPSPVDYALFVAFFPHLLAGPILRARRLIPEFKDPAPTLGRNHRNEGLELLLVGLGKKIVFGDVLTSAARSLLAEPGQVSAPMVVVGLAAAIVGVYFDVSGYIDVARGSARLLGVHLPPNFAQPLTRSHSFTDFWRRWQITIMAWFRDYVYRPLRGRSRSLGREHVALVLTFVVVAAWHGSGAPWFVWALFTSGVLVVERTVQHHAAARRRAARAAGEGAGAAGRPSPWGIRLRRAGSLAYVWACVLLMTVWITAPSVGDGIELLEGLVTLRSGESDVDAVAYLLLALVALVLFDRREVVRVAREGQLDPATNLRLTAFASLVVGIVVFSGNAPQAFLYFQF